MSERHLKGWLKHGDFIILDILCMALSFSISYWIRFGFGNPFEEQTIQFQAVIFFLSQLVIILFGNNYEGILRRGKLEEFLAVFRYILEILFVGLLYLFITHNTIATSRLQFGYTSVLFLVIDYIVRGLNKFRIIRLNTSRANQRSVVLMTSEELVDEAMRNLSRDDEFQGFFVSAIVLMNGESPDFVSDYGVPVMVFNKDAIQQISHNWVDEVFILLPDDQTFPLDAVEYFREMGLTINYTVASINNRRWKYSEMRKLGSYNVITTSVRMAAYWEFAVKRIIDILGGIVGCILTGILILIIGPIIYIKSPGPIFFAQERVGKNGKTFRMYKFRSMYMDAEARKEALMKENMANGAIMFKMDDDPRIIGSEKKDKKGRPCGIGNFIRNTSLDEFPQFFNVLIGNMSLVGWRPATVDEWERYELKHRIRASMKPGLTGMWQVSGRSDVKDFDKVVELDREYMENWSLKLDFKILLKTVKVVLTRQGAK
ncbi:MAG: sugar transferase [Lachnospiraceae bacterium]|nr:sugar transferase [Lachnospiraceae bacterium]